MGDVYPFFEWDMVIEVNETVVNYEEENIIVGK